MVLLDLFDFRGPSGGEVPLSVEEVLAVGEFGVLIPPRPRVPPASDPIGQPHGGRVGRRLGRKQSRLGHGSGMTPERELPS